MGELEVLDWPFYFEDEADSNHMTWRVTIETLAALASSSLHAAALLTNDTFLLM